MGTLVGPAANAYVRTFKLFGKPLKEGLKRSILHFASYDAQTLGLPEVDSWVCKVRGCARNHPSKAIISHEYFIIYFFCLDNLSSTSTL